ncbi:MAG: hypothetical protein RSC02_02460 [Malacoplasma sp.]
MFTNIKNSELNFENTLKKVDDANSVNDKKKKRTSIIVASSIIGTLSLASIVLVPLALTDTLFNSSTLNVVLEKITNIFNPVTKNVKLIIDGVNLPKDKNLYIISNVTNPNNKQEIPSRNIALLQQKSQVILDFDDPHFSTPTPIYSVRVNVDNLNKAELNSVDNIVAPTISIIDNPSSQTISPESSNQMVRLFINANVDTQIKGESLRYQWHTLKTDSDWVPIPGATTSTYNFDATNLEELSKQYFKCVIDYKYAKSTTSEIVFVEKLISVPTPPPVTPPPSVDDALASISRFNSKPVKEKIDAYNSIMANASNNTKIYNNFFIEKGILNFFDTNVETPTDYNTAFTYNNFKAFLDTYNVLNTTISPVLNDNGKNFLSLKGVLKESVYTQDTIDNINYESKYNYHYLTGLNPYWDSYNFFSMAKESIVDLKINNDFSMTATLNNTKSNFSFRIIVGDGSDYFFNYKNTVQFNNSTLFSGMSDYVKTSILKLTN